MALAVMNTFQGYVQHADAKVSTLVVVHAGAAVAAMAAPTGLTSRHGAVAAVVVAIFATAFVMSGYHLVQALRPRMHAPLRRSAFGITGIGEHPPAGMADQRDEAWAMARLFAEMAQVKHGHVARAIPWTATMLVVGLAAALMGVVA